jgi:hypothetical protein
MTALHVLQKEMRGLDYAQERVRRLLTAQQDEADPDE